MQVMIEEKLLAKLKIWKSGLIAEYPRAGKFDFHGKSDIKKTEGFVNLRIHFKHSAWHRVVFLSSSEFNSTAIPPTDSVAGTATTSAITVSKCPRASIIAILHRPSAVSQFSQLLFLRCFSAVSSELSKSGVGIFR